MLFKKQCYICTQITTKKIEIMYTYLLQFDNGAKFKSTDKNLDQAHIKIVKKMNDEDLKECIITCPNKVIRRVRKTGATHWNHEGFEFD